MVSGDSEGMIIVEVSSQRELSLFFTASSILSENGSLLMIIESLCPIERGSSWKSGKIQSLCIVFSSELIGAEGGDIISSSLGLSSSKFTVRGSSWDGDFITILSLSSLFHFGKSFCTGLSQSGMA